MQPNYRLPVSIARELRMSTCSYNLQMNVHSDIIHNNHSRNNPSVHRRVHGQTKSGVIHTREYYSAIKRNGAVTLENVGAQRRKSDTEVTCRMVPLTGNAQIHRAVKTEGRPVGDGSWGEAGDDCCWARSFSLV